MHTYTFVWKCGETRSVTSTSLKEALAALDDNALHPRHADGEGEGTLCNHKIVSVKMEDS